MYVYRSQSRNRLSSTICPYQSSCSGTSHAQIGRRPHELEYDEPSENLNARCDGYAMADSRQGIILHQQEIGRLVGGDAASIRALRSLYVAQDPARITNTPQGHTDSK